MAGGAKFGTCPMARQRPSLKLLSSRSPSLLPPLPRGLQWDPPALAFAFHTAFIDCEDGRVLRATGEAQGCATPSPALCTPQAALIRLCSTRRCLGWARGLRSCVAAVGAVFWCASLDALSVARLALPQLRAATQP